MGKHGGSYQYDGQVSRHYKHARFTYARHEWLGIVKLDAPLLARSDGWKLGPKSFVPPAVELGHARSGLWKRIDRDLRQRIKSLALKLLDREWRVARLLTRP